MSNGTVVMTLNDTICRTASGFYYWFQTRGKYKSNKLCEPNGERGAQSYNGLTGVWGEATSRVQGQSRGILRPWSWKLYGSWMPEWGGKSAPFSGIFKAFSNRPCRPILLLWCVSPSFQTSPFISMPHGGNTGFSMSMSTVVTCNNLTCGQH